jgi:hypothetical protein
VRYTRFCFCGVIQKGIGMGRRKIRAERRHQSRARRDKTKNE